MSGYRALKAGLVGLACLAGLCAPARAEERVTLGWGRMFHNDAIGDGNDRWQSGGSSVSMVRGVSYGGTLPASPGEILEFRLAADIMAPADLSSPAADDRRYAGALSFGVHTHFDWKGTEIILGGDLVATGPQNGIGRYQSWVHERLDMPVPGALDDQIENGIHPTLLAEAGPAMPLAAARRGPSCRCRRARKRWCGWGPKILVDAMALGKSHHSFQVQINELLRLTAQHTIKWKWIKAHNGNTFNERCDELCTRMRDLKTTHVLNGIAPR